MKNTTIKCEACDKTITMIKCHSCNWWQSAEKEKSYRTSAAPTQEQKEEAVKKVKEPNMYMLKIKESVVKLGKTIGFIGLGLLCLMAIVGGMWLSFVGISYFGEMINTHITHFHMDRDGFVYWLIGLGSLILPILTWKIILVVKNLGKYVVEIYKEYERTKGL